MDINEKNLIIKKLLECIGQVINMDLEDGSKEDILIGLSELLKKATQLSTKKEKRLWVEPRRMNRAERGTLTFLAKKRLLNDDSSYKSYLMVSKSQFEFLLTLVQQYLKRSNTEMRDAISPAEKLALTLRFLATGESFQSLDYTTGLSKSAISNAVPKVCEMLLKQLKGSYLKFPNSLSEWEDIANEFDVNWQFPNCIGALGRKHINFRPSRKDGTFFHKHKGTSSIILMALVDANYKFIFVDVGCNGPDTDAGVFLQSELGTVLKEEEEIPRNTEVGNGRCLPYVVVSDDAFPMQTHLMTPYPYTNSVEKQVFNERLSRARHVVEHTLGILGNRFRVLLAPLNLRAEKVQTIALTCCALHNFFMERDDTYVNTFQNYTPVINASTSDSTLNPVSGRVEAIRQEFTAYFNNEGKLDWLQQE